jgi:3-oxoacyl-[acyl-carrier-protein] synthase II
MPSCVITASAAVSPLGATLDATWRALLQGESISTLARVPIDRTTTLPRATQLAHVCVSQLLASCQVDRHTALVVGTSKGTVEHWTNSPVEPIGLHEIASSIAAAFSIAGPRTTVSAACASGLHALFRAKLMLDRNEADRVLVVASESSLGDIFTGSFTRLGVFPRYGEPCRPFDQHRSGFLMSEAAACVMIERREPRPGDLILRDVRFAGDATHLTGMDARGQTLRRLIGDVVAHRPVDLVHAHATGTHSDAIELAAISDCVRGSPVVYSHKGALGHSLGASGLLGVALSTLMHSKSLVPGNANLVHPLEHAGLTLSSAPVARKITRSLGIASGFGGATATVCLETSS